MPKKEKERTDKKTRVLDEFLGQMDITALTVLYDIMFVSDGSIRYGLARKRTVTAADVFEELEKHADNMYPKEPPAHMAHIAKRIRAEREAFDATFPEFKIVVSPLFPDVGSFRGFRVLEESVKKALDARKRIPT